MDYKAQTIKELSEKRAQASSLKTMVGFDGFIDHLMTGVGSRHGQGDNFEPIPTITDFGQRILNAAGKSTNIELYPKILKLGGNGPIMANAIVNAGVETKYIGALGKDEIHPLFKNFAEDTNAVSIADPAITHALEFNDGKLMLGTMASLDSITYQNIIETMGEGLFFDCISRCDLIAMVNWTMIPNMTSIFDGILEKVLPNLGPHENRHFFFDLADPEKRSKSDLKTVLACISKYQSHGHTTLGLNLKEGQRVHEVLDFKSVEPSPDGIKQMASEICRKLDIGMVVIHPTNGAACANKDDAWHVEGPFCEKPMTTTGAGDHFNAGFTIAQSLGMSPIAALTTAVSFSGSYVRTAKSPTLNDIDNFIKNWQ